MICQTLKERKYDTIKQTLKFAWGVSKSFSCGEGVSFSIGFFSAKILTSCVFLENNFFLKTVDNEKTKIVLTPYSKNKFILGKFLFSVLLNIKWLKIKALFPKTFESFWESLAASCVCTRLEILIYISKNRNSFMHNF